jgi:hypothetical protein
MSLLEKERYNGCTIAGSKYRLTGLLTALNTGLQ